MARGRKPKELTVATKVDHAKLLKEFEQTQRIQLEKFYEKLAIIRRKVDDALTKVGFMDECESLAQAAFKAGRAYGPLDEANDEIQEMLDDIYENNDFGHYDDIYEKN